MHNPTPQLRTWLTPRRLRAHGLLVGLVLWSVYAWIFATPGLRDRNGLLKGTDFLHFYTLGALALEHDGADLYNMQAESALALQRVPDAGHLVYVPLYGPQVSLLFAPLATLPYAWALTVWLAASAALYAVCCYAIWKTCPTLQSLPGTTLIVTAASPPFVHLIVWGQNSALALVCFALAYLALRSQRCFSAGLAMGCLIFKPQLALAAVLVFLLTRQWRVIAGMVMTASAQLLVGQFYYGSAVMKDYAYHLFHAGSIYPLLEPRPYHMHSLRAFWAMLIPWPWFAFAFYVATAVTALGLTVRCWKTPAPLTLRYAALLLATVLVSPHLTVYDLVILAPAFLLLADWAGAHREQRQAPTVGILLYLCYALPLTVPVTRWTHVQLSVPAMATLLWLVQRQSTDASYGSTVPAAESGFPKRKVSAPGKRDAQAPSLWVTPSATSTASRC